MHSGWIRVSVLFAVAMLLANTQCYGACTAALRRSAEAPSTSCHHHKSSHGDDAACPYSHSEFAGPEVRIAQISVATAIPILPVLAADSSAVIPEPPVFSQSDTGSPPGVDISLAISVLRI